MYKRADKIIEETKSRNPFSGGSPILDPFESPPSMSGFLRKVMMTCTYCNDVKHVNTEDFRLNWECDKCKNSPLLLKIVGRYLKETGIDNQPS